MDQNDTNQQNNLQTQVEDLTKKVGELDNSWKRALADYKNLEKRMFEEKVEFASYANSNLLYKLLPIVDNLELLDIHLNDMGLKLVLKELKQILTEQGITEVETKDKEFDAEKMEAIELVDGPKNIVVETLNKGYLIKNKLLRPARVRVGKN